MKTYRVTVDFSGYAEYTIKAESAEEVEKLFMQTGSFDRIANRFRDRVDECIDMIEEVEDEEIES